MFDWFWEFLYLITKSIFRLVDALMSTSNILCGIDPILIDGEEEDFLQYVVFSTSVFKAFKVAAVLGIIVVAFFGILAIIRTVVKEKAEGTPAQIAIKAAKSILLFFFVPACMTVIVYVLNFFAQAIYTATLPDGNISLGTFLFGTVSQDARLSGTSASFYLSEDFNFMGSYTDTDLVEKYYDLSEIDYFFAWVAGVAILVNIARATITFIDRALSIAILFIASPFSIATTVIDDGSHFKLWRDQVLVKFITGYGMILALNIYTILVSVIAPSSVVIFPQSSFINSVIKLAIILGGGVSLNRLMGVIGNLVQAGAGTNEASAAADSLNKAKGVVKGAARAAKGIATAPFKAARAVNNFARDASRFGIGASIAKRLGWKTQRDYISGGWTPDENPKKGGGEKKEGDNSNNKEPENNNSNVQTMIQNNNEDKEKEEKKDNKNSLANTINNVGLKNSINDDNSNNK